MAHMTDEDSDLEHFDSEDNFVHDPNAIRHDYVPYSVEHSIS